MKSHEIQSILANAIPLQEIYVSGDENHFQITVISKIFEDISIVKRQQIVYSPLMKYIEEKIIHSLSIKTYSPEEWKHNCNLNII